MQSKFMNYEQLKGSGGNKGEKAGAGGLNLAASRRASVLPNPLGFGNSRPKRQGLGLNNNVQDLLAVTGFKPDAAVL